MRASGSEVYARCMTGMEDVWIARMNQHSTPKTRPVVTTRMTTLPRMAQNERAAARGAYGAAEGVRVRRFLSHPDGGWQSAVSAVTPGRHGKAARSIGAPPVGFEPTHPPPEGGALSPELWGLAR